MRNNLISAFLLAVTLAVTGCASPDDEESGATSASGISKANAHDELLRAGRFKTLGHSACGRALTFAGTPGTDGGTYQLDVVDCEDGQPTRVRHAEGTFTVVGGWGWGVLSDPKVKLAPYSSTGEDGLPAPPLPWELTVSEIHDLATGLYASVELVDASGTRFTPEGFLD